LGTCFAALDASAWLGGGHPKCAYTQAQKQFHRRRALRRLLFAFR
jgi:hypothetical protein